MVLTSVNDTIHGVIRCRQAVVNCSQSCLNDVQPDPDIAGFGEGILGDSVSLND